MALPITCLICALKHQGHIPPAAAASCCPPASEESFAVPSPLVRPGPGDCCWVRDVTASVRIMCVYWGLKSRGPPGTERL